VDRPCPLCGALCKQLWYTTDFFCSDCLARFDDTEVLVWKQDPITKMLHATCVPKLVAQRDNLRRVFPM
jgi:protein-arginine kinase activator protein McsA